MMWLKYLRTCHGLSAPTLQHSSAGRFARTSSGVRSVQLNLLHLQLNLLLHHLLQQLASAMKWEERLLVETWPAFSGLEVAV